MDDFEAFRQRKKKMQEEERKAAERAAQPSASGKAQDWEDGLGPSGPANPKVKGFVLGRYRKKKVDPRTLQKPEGYEPTSAGSLAAKRKTQAEIELERKMAALQKAQEELEALEAKRAEAEIAERRKKEGYGSIKGRQRY